MGTGVEFEEPEFVQPPPHFTSRSILGQPTTPGMIKILMKTGLVSNENIAGMILIGISGVFFAGAIFLYLFNPFI